jgi:hypothetical protein
MEAAGNFKDGIAMEAAIRKGLHGIDPVERF